MAPSTSFIRPSAAKRCFQCRGALALQKRLELPDRPAGEAADEGTLAHAGIETVLTYLEDMEFSVANKDIPFDVLLKGFEEEMKEHIIEYVYLVNTFIRSKPKENILKVYIEKVVHFNEDCFGTVDFGCCWMDNGVVTVSIIDFKYGRYALVKVDNNIQLTIYGLALAKLHDAKRLTMRIVQPRRSDSDEHSAIMDYDEMVKATASITQMIEDVKQNIMSDKLMLSTGDECIYCPCLAHCPKVREEVQAEETAFLPVIQDAGDKMFDISRLDEYPVSQLAHLLSKSKLIEKFLDAVEKLLSNKLMAGEDVPGFKMVDSITKRKWNGTPDEIGPELIKLGIQDPYRKSLITLGNAEEIIGKEAVNKLTIKPMPTPKIAPLSDRREALSFDSEGEVFDIIETES